MTHKRFVGLAMKAILARMKRKNIIIACMLAVTGVTGLLLWAAVASSPAPANRLAMPATLPAGIAASSAAETAAVPADAAPVPPEPSNAATTEAQALPPISGKMAAAIRQHEDRGDESTSVITRADGSMKATPPNGFRTTTVAVIGADGKLVIRHGGDFLSNVTPDNNAAK